VRAGGLVFAPQDDPRGVGIDEDQLLACGISIGYADETAPENVWRTDRADIDEWVTFFDE
jgi:nitroreductase